MSLFALIIATDIPPLWDGRGAHLARRSGSFFPVPCSCPPCTTPVPAHYCAVQVQHSSPRIRTCICARVYARVYACTTSICACASHPLGHPDDVRKASCSWNTEERDIWGTEKTSEAVDRWEIGVVCPLWGQGRDLPSRKTRLAYGVRLEALTMLMMSIRVS